MTDFLTEFIIFLLLAAVMSILIHYILGVF